MKVCKICGSIEGRLRYSVDGFDVIQCSGCSVVSLDLKKNTDPSNLYSKDYYHEREAYYLKNSIVDPVNGIENPNIIDFREGLKVIESYKASGRLLDVGCAMGVFLAMAKEKGWDVFGVDVSVYGTGFAKEKFGINCFAGRLRDAHLPDRHFDAITLWDVIEHFEDPLKELNEIRRILSDDGIIIFNTPNVESLMRSFTDWIYKGSFGFIKYPVKKLYHEFHLYYFSSETLVMLLNMAGFEIIEMNKKTIPITKARGNRWEKLIVKAITELEKSMHREFEIFVIARKRRGAD